MSVPDSIEPNLSPAIPELLGRQIARSGWRRRIAWLAGAVLLPVAAAFALRRGEPDDRRPTFKTESVTVGALTVKVSVTGTLKPTNNVEVGSELSGLVAKVLVDENDRVTKGAPLAQLDLSKLNDGVARSRAAVAAAEAQVLQSAATVMEARATLDRYEQVSKLSGGKVPSRAEMDAGRANLTRAEANAAVTRANVPQARATLRSDETNLGKATIRSPIDGVVLSRKVDPGQTVAATLQTPVLFTIAEDLQKMELQVDVDEADVGQVKVGQPVTFTVDAWPGRKYAGVVTRLGYGSQTKNGVVSYPAVIAVDNRDLSLRPGMTATAEIVTVAHADAVLVPNAALRFTPAPPEGALPMPPKGGATEGGPPKGGGFIGRLLPHPPERPRIQAATQTATQPPSNPSGGARVWILRDGSPTPIAVRTGATNGQVTEILGGSLSAGTAVIAEMLGSEP